MEPIAEACILGLHGGKLCPLPQQNTPDRDTQDARVACGAKRLRGRAAGGDHDPCRTSGQAAFVTGSGAKYSIDPRAIDQETQVGIVDERQGSAPAGSVE